MNDVADSILNWAAGNATFSEATQMVNKFSYDSLAYHHRQDSANNGTCAYPSVASSFTTTIVNNPDDLQSSISFGAQSGSVRCGIDRVGADVSSFVMTLRSRSVESFPEDTSPDQMYSFPGSQSGNIGFFAEQWGLEDANSNEIAFLATAVGERRNSSSTGIWSGTNYVDMDVYELNYGTSCTYTTTFDFEVGVYRSCNNINNDSTYDSDLAGSLYGFKTFLADVPSNGASTYRTFAVGVGAYGVGDILNLGIAPIYTPNCGGLPSYSDCTLNYIYSAAGEQLISVDFAANTITGTISLQDHYVISSLSNAGINQLTSQNQQGYDAYNATVQNLSFTGTISGNSFSGTISNAHFSGIIVGSFYGPQAAEIGAIIRLDHLGFSGGDYETSGAFSMISLVGLKL